MLVLSRHRGEIFDGNLDLFLVLPQLALQHPCFWRSPSEAAANGIVITDREGTILWVNRSFTKMTGYTPEEALGKNPRILRSGKQSTEFYSQLWQTITAGNVWRGTLCNQRKDGSEYFEEQTITPIRNAHGQVSNFIAIKEAISEKRYLEEHG